MENWSTRHVRTSNHLTSTDIACTGAGSANLKLVRVYLQESKKLLWSYAELCSPSLLCQVGIRSFAWRCLDIRREDPIRLDVLSGVKEVFDNLLCRDSATCQVSWKIVSIVGHEVQWQLAFRDHFHLLAKGRMEH